MTYLQCECSYRPGPRGGGGGDTTSVECLFSITPPLPTHASYGGDCMLASDAATEAALSSRGSGIARGAFPSSTAGSAAAAFAAATSSAARAAASCVLACSRRSPLARSCSSPAVARRLPSHSGLMDSACHVIGCQSTQEARVQNAFDDVASTIHQTLPATIRSPAAERAAAAGAAAAAAAAPRSPGKARLSRLSRPLPRWHARHRVVAACCSGASWNSKQTLISVYGTLVSCAETIGAFNTVFDTVKLHRPTLWSPMNLAGEERMRVAEPPIRARQILLDASWGAVSCSSSNGGSRCVGYCAGRGQLSRRRDIERWRKLS